MLEADFLVAEFDRLQPGIDKHLYLGRHGGGEAEIVGSCHAVDYEAGIVAACDRANDGTIVLNRGFPGQAADSRAVIEPAINAAEIAVFSSR